jgi:ribosomal protein S18 acetylase RimI-like enzyme
MIRKNKSKLSETFTDDYYLKAFTEKDAQTYADIRNAAFMNLKGSEVAIEADRVMELYKDTYVLNKGMCLLYHRDEAIGVIRMLKEEDETGRYSFVAPIAIKPAYQGKGLGVKLLEAGIVIGQENGYKDCMLVVNAENEHALKLYKKVDFEIDMAVACYHKKTK